MRTSRRLRRLAHSLVSCGLGAAGGQAHNSQKLFANCRRHYLSTLLSEARRSSVVLLIELADRIAVAARTPCSLPDPKGRRVASLASWPGSASLQARISRSKVAFQGSEESGRENLSSYNVAEPNKGPVFFLHRLIDDLVNIYFRGGPAWLSG